MNFALIGIGYIAPRHLRAIKETGHTLVAAYDPRDSVGILDQYFPNASFFTEFERFDRHLEKLRRAGHGVDYVSICSPNYLHDAHIRFALRIGANAICEKPVVIKPHNIDALKLIEAETGKRIYTVLQLRLHPVIVALKKSMGREVHRVNLTYHTPRGKWYHVSWKGQKEKSGGLIMNIGVHLLDMLTYVFGPIHEIWVDYQTKETVSGTLTFQRADVRFNLSVAQGKRIRSMTMDGTEVDFTDGFEDLHTRVYEEILAGQGFGLEDCRDSITLAQKIGEERASPNCCS